MKQLTLFHKVIIMFMLLLLLTECCATPDTEQMNDSHEFSFQVVQVRDMQEDKLPLENIIRTLKKR